MVSDLFKKGDDIPLLNGPAFGLLALLLIVLLVVWSVAAQRRKGGYGASKPARLVDLLHWQRLSGKDATLRVVLNKRLTASSSLHVVEWEGERLLLASANAGVQCLSRRKIGAADDGTAP